MEITHKVFASSKCNSNGCDMVPIAFSYLKDMTFFMAMSLTMSLAIPLAMSLAMAMVMSVAMALYFN